ncbi:MAG: hypothetical protein FWF56_06070 [Firmicutes bacterium]|nr:hypothetical protein [Bacillota bacterium]MCL1953953.1 hypothetical protein [Bacillota bacterium]
MGQVISPDNPPKVEANMYAVNLLHDNEGGAFLMKGVMYNCYDLLRRALLTVDTQLINTDNFGLDTDKKK